MTPSEFFKKFKSWYLWGNLLAMALVVVLLCAGIKFGLDIYTRHGEEIVVPDVRHKLSADAKYLLTEAGLKVVVSDTGYVKKLPEDCVLQQMPDAGAKVKKGRVVYLTVNSSNTPRLTIPDIIDNCSLREAMARLTAMGFKLGQPKFVTGEADWVYGILVRGRHVMVGDKVPIEETLVIEVGNGQISAADSVEYVESSFEDENMEHEIVIDHNAEDNFEVVPGTEGDASAN